MVASGAPVHNVDLGMCGEADIAWRLHAAARESDLILVEGVMGLYDGAPSGADIARRFGIPVMAVIDARAMAQTFGAVALARPEMTVAVPDDQARVVLVIDQSGSMAATDVPPSRMAATRRAAAVPVWPLEKPAPGSIGSVRRLCPSPTAATISASLTITSCSASRSRSAVNRSNAAPNCSGVIVWNRFA